MDGSGTYHQRTSLTIPTTIPVTNSETTHSDHAAVPSKTDASEIITPPPPYTDEDRRRSNGSFFEENRISNADNRLVLPVPSAANTYSVPNDVSEGLSNPVFDNALNPDGDDDGRSKQIITIVTPTEQKSAPTVVPTNTSFTSLTSYGQQYESQTTLYVKDKLDDTFDAEKGKPCAGDLSSKDNTPNSKKGKDKEYKGLKKYVGLLLTLSASFFFSVVVLFVKVLNDYGFDAYGASFWRYTGTVVPVIPLLFFYECGPGTKKQSSVFTSVWPIRKNWKTWLGLLSRGLIGSTSVILRYYALKYLSIGDTSVITYSTPVLVTVLAHFFLGERLTIFAVIVAIVTLCGVVIVTQPPLLTGESDFDTNKLIGTGLACGSLFCSALIVIITRKIREVHFTVMTLVFGIIGVAQALILIYFLGDFNLPTELTDSLLVAGVAALSFLGQMAIVLALKFEQAGPVSLIRSCDVLFGFLFQYLFRNEAPNIFSGSGAVIVLTGVLSTGFRKWLNTLPEDDSRRKRFWFILK